MVRRRCEDLPAMAHRCGALKPSLPSSRTVPNSVCTYVRSAAQVTSPERDGDVQRDALAAAPGLLVFAGQRLVSHRCCDHPRRSACACCCATREPPGDLTWAELRQAAARKLSDAANHEVPARLWGATLIPARYCRVPKHSPAVIARVCCDALWHTPTCVCVCVCEREREREREAIHVNGALARSSNASLCGTWQDKVKYFEVTILSMKHNGPGISVGLVQKGNSLTGF